MVTQISNATKQLDSMFANVVNQTIEAERQLRLVDLRSKRDSLDVKNAVYTDLQKYVSDLQTSVKALLSTDSAYKLGVTQKATVSNVSDGLSVINATTDDEATPANYQISIQTLAKQHRVASERAVSSSSALNYSGSISVNGKAITISTGDSLYAIAGKINEVEYEDGKEVIASVIDNRLVLSAAESGAENELVLSGDALTFLGILDSEGTFIDELSEATDAVFTVNGLSVTRSSNSEIDDVIQGVTLNLAADGEGSSATLTIGTDTDNIKKYVNDMLSKYNDLIGYMDKKTTTTKVDDTTYQRGSLSDDYTVRNLIGELADTLVSSISGDDVTSLYELGIEVGDNMKISIKDSSKLEAALESGRENVLSFFDAKWNRLNNMLGRYVGSEKA